MNVRASRFQPLLKTPWDVRVMNLATIIIVVMVVLVGCIIGLWLLISSRSFSFTRINVYGQTTHSNAQSLKTRVLPLLQGNFFTLNMTQAQAAFQSAPWVQSAIVRRRFPGLLEVFLKEYKPYAHWGLNSSQMIDVNGVLFDTGNQGLTANLAKLPTLIGPRGQTSTVLQMYALLSAVVAPMHARLAMLELQDRGSWRAQLMSLDQPSRIVASNDSQVEPDDVQPSRSDQDSALDTPTFSAVIELGSGMPDELAARLQTFVTTAPSVAARHQRSISDITNADLVYPNGYALRLRGITTNQPVEATTPAVAIQRHTPSAPSTKPAKVRSRVSSRAAASPTRR